MSGAKKLAVILLIVLGSFGAAEQPVQAQEEDTDYVEEFLGFLDTEELDSYLDDKEETEDISFYELVKDTASGELNVDRQNILKKAGAFLWGEISDNKGILVTVLLLALSCSFVRNFADIFHNNYISDICFLMIYIELMALLMKSFFSMNAIVSGAIGNAVDFMNMLVPVFCMSLSIGMANLTAAGFYQLAFLVIYVVQWVLLSFLLPMVQILIIAEFMNYMVPGEKFGRMCELIEAGIRWCLKFAVTATVGLNVVQGMIAPAIDRLKMSTITKTIRIIPGVGNAANALSEMMLGAGIVLKNSVGIAGILILLLLCLIPFFKMLVLSVLYKLTAAVTEPISDKRIAGSINGVYVGCVLMQKILLTSLVLFIVTVAMIAASSSFAMQ